MRFIVCISFICALAWGQGARPARQRPAQGGQPAPAVQNVPSPPEIADIVARITRASEVARQVESDFATLLEKPGVDAVKAADLVEKADASVNNIKKLLDQLDARYEVLSEDQRSVVRQAWTISMLLGAFVANQKESMDGLKTEDGRKESQVNAQCAVRRAVMLEETLKGLVR